MKQEMKDTAKLKKGAYIAFLWRYMPTDPPEIVVTNITQAYDDHYLVHFTYGHHSISEEVKFQDIIAIGDEKKGTAKLPGWQGRYIIIKEVPQMLPNCPICNGQREWGQPYRTAKCHFCGREMML